LPGGLGLDQRLLGLRLARHDGLPRTAAVTETQLLRWLLLLRSFLGLARHFVSVIIFGRTTAYE